MIGIRVGMVRASPTSYHCASEEKSYPIDIMG